MKKKISSVLVSFSIIASVIPIVPSTAGAESGDTVKSGDYLETDTYTITVSSESYTGGEIFVFTEAAEGDEVVMLAVPDYGYELVSLTVAGESVNYTIGNGVTKCDNDICTFTMPDENVDITPAFAPVTVVGTTLTYNDFDGIVKVTSDTPYENAYFITSKYTDDGTLVDVASEKVNITTDEPFTKSCATDSVYNTKYMLWDSLDTMKPLASASAAENTAVSTLSNATVSTVGTNTFTKPQIVTADVPDTDDRHTIGAVDVSLGEGEQLDGIAEVRIKYDPDKGYNAANLLPGYYDPENDEWETVPYMIDEDNNEVIILTDHFSRFGLFEVEKSGTPTAFAQPLSAAQLANMPAKTASKLLSLANKDALDFDEDAVGEVLNALDGSYNNNYTNTAGAINTFVSRGGAISNGVIGKIGKQFAIIGVTAAAINTAKTAYTKGATTETALTAGKSIIGLIPYPPVQIAYAIYGLAEMAYTHYDEKVISENKNSLSILFKNYQYDRIVNKDLNEEKFNIWFYLNNGNSYREFDEKMRYWNEYGMMEYWDERFKKCYDSVYTDGMSESTSEDAAHRFERFRSSISSQIHAYAHEFSAEFADGKRYQLENSDRNKAMAAEICESYDAQLMNRLSPLFKKYSLQAYSDAVKLLEKECEKLRAELNGTITLNFYEEKGETADLAKNCYILFDTAKNKQWRADFDEDGRTTLSFTLLGYSELGCPDSAVVFRKDTNKPIGRIYLPTEMEPGNSYNVPFSTGGFTQTIRIHEVKGDETDEYLFAGMSGRFRELNDFADTDMYSFTLDDTGCATVEMTLDDYVNDGEAQWIEIVDNNGVIVYQTRFSIAVTDVPLSADMYSVNIRCKDDDAKERFRNTTAKIVYEGEQDGAAEIICEADMDINGTARLMFEKSKYEFLNKSYWLYIYDESGESIIDSRDLSAAFKDKKTVETVVLEYSPMEPEYDPLNIKETAITIKGTGGSERVTVVSGEIARTSSDDPSVATASGSLIQAHNAGKTTITFEDIRGYTQKVIVTVVEVNEFIDGYYRTSIIYESSAGMTSSVREWDPGAYSVGYSYVQMHIVDDGSVNTVYTQNSAATRFYRLDAETGEFKRSTVPDKEEWHLEDVSVDHFKLSITFPFADWIVTQVYYYERTTLDGFPPEGYTGLGE